MSNTTRRIATAFHRKTEGSVSAPGGRREVGGVRLSSPQPKGHRAQDRTRALQAHEVEGAARREDGGEDGVGSSIQRSSLVKMPKVGFIPAFCSGHLSFVEAALRTLSQQKHWGWPWRKHTF